MNAYSKYKNRLEKFLQTERGKRLINFAYSIGAAIVILGAMFKLLHFPFGNELLFIGMITEVIVFTLSAFDTPIRDYNWDRVFPALTSDKPGEVQHNITTKRDNEEHQTTKNISETPLTPHNEDYSKQVENLKTETEKMAKQLKELNEIYARMLQAMSAKSDQ